MDVAVPAAALRARLFAGLVAGWVGGLAIFNWTVNPWRLYSPRLLPPRVLDLRYQKCDLLSRRQPPPEQLVLGSSRMLRFEPAYLERRTGLRSFNAAVPGGTPADALALYRFAGETAGAPVRRVLLGVEAQTFLGDRRSYPALRANPRLRRFLPAAEDDRSPAAGRFADLPLLLNGQQARDAWAACVRHLGIGGRSVPEDDSHLVLAPDGWEQWNAWDRGRSGPDAAAARARREEALRSQVGPATPRDPVAFRDLRLLLERLRRDRVEAVLVATPVLAPMRRLWEENGAIEHERVLLPAARALAAEYGARFVDFSRVERFGGDPGEFYDWVHPKATSTRRMIDALFPAGGGSS